MGGHGKGAVIPVNGAYEPPEPAAAGLQTGVPRAELNVPGMQMEKVVVPVSGEYCPNEFFRPDVSTPEALYPAGDFTHANALEELEMEPGAHGTQDN